MNDWIDYGLILQARLGSSRLPGKVLMNIDGQEMLYRQIDRLQNGISSSIPIIIATSDHSSDDLIEAFCDKHGIKIFREYYVFGFFGKVILGSPQEIFMICRRNGLGSRQKRLSWF